MSHISTNLEVLEGHLHPTLKPKLIADGYYTEVLGALDALKVDVRKVHAVIALLKLDHIDNHQPGPMYTCTEICMMADAL